MKKIRMFLLIIAAMLVAQMYEPAAICEVQAATKTTAKKNVRVNGLYKGKYNYCYYQHGRKSEMHGRLLTERNIILEETDMLTEEAVM